MNKSIEEKLRILSDAAKYDVSCSSSGSSIKNKIHPYYWSSLKIWYTKNDKSWLKKI